MPPWLIIVGGGVGLGAIVQFLRGKRPPQSQPLTAVKRGQAVPGITPDEQVEDTTGAFLYAPRPIPGSEADPAIHQSRGRARATTTPTVAVTTAPPTVAKPGPARPKVAAKPAPRPAPRPAPKPAPRPALTPRSPKVAVVRNQLVRVPSHSRYGAIYRAVVKSRVSTNVRAVKRPGGTGGGGGVKVT